MKLAGIAVGARSRVLSVPNPPFPRLVLAVPLPAAVLLAGILLSGIFLPGCAGNAARGERPDRRDGIWEGSGQGWGGEIRVRLRINSSLIQEIEVVSHSEDIFIGGEAMGELLELVLDYQNTGLDAVSGATESSAGFLAAVEDALNRAALGPPP
jgi:fumarate reductase flavoprotein subunit